MSLSEIADALGFSSECDSCGEVDNDDCPKSERPCGHHCNHVCHQADGSANLD
jgi:hypothetical protein